MSGRGYMMEGNRIIMLLFSPLLIVMVQNLVDPVAKSFPDTEAAKEPVIGMPAIVVDGPAVPSIVTLAFVRRP
jgi:hypothetical protein